MPARSKPIRRSPLAIKLGDAVRRARIQKNLTQEQLAERAALSKNYIGNIERGEYDVTVSALKQVADGLELPAGDILRLAGI